jgi:signal peptidase I
MGDLPKSPPIDSGLDAKSRLARRRKQTAAAIFIGFGSITIILVVLAHAFPTAIQVLARPSDFRAFKVPSQSMCPTICPGERIVADMAAYDGRLPQRGEVVLLEVPALQMRTLFVKRVIGVAGDTVEAGSNNEILVDGKPLTPPRVCGTPILGHNHGDELPGFATTKVPEGYFFVVGDNLADSNDSRFPEFGLVATDQLRGKPLFIYWSAGHSRIGCATQ